MGIKSSQGTCVTKGWVLVGSAHNSPVTSQ